MTGTVVFECMEGMYAGSCGDGTRRVSRDGYLVVARWECCLAQHCREQFAKGNGEERPMWLSGAAVLLLVHKRLKGLPSLSEKRHIVE